MSNRPNILFIMTDEQRGDALGGLPGSLVDTPYLEELRTSGVDFSKAYSACPVCVPARRTLMTGKTPYHHGVLMIRPICAENCTSPLSASSTDSAAQTGQTAPIAAPVKMTMSVT